MSKAAIVLSLFVALTQTACAAGDFVESDENLDSESDENVAEASQALNWSFCDPTASYNLMLTDWTMNPDPGRATVGYREQFEMMPHNISTFLPTLEETVRYSGRFLSKTSTFLCGLGDFTQACPSGRLKFNWSLRHNPTSLYTFTVPLGATLDVTREYRNYDGRLLLCTKHTILN